MVTITNNAMKISLVRKIDDSYDIVFGANLFAIIAKELKEMKYGSNYAIITDSNVKPLYGLSLKNALDGEGIKSDIFPFEAGEKNKTRETKIIIEDQMLEAGLGRDTIILALGGGVVGDLAGFIAATYCRGIHYIQIPTTILAQADSSIGGKTAVDTKHGKNLIGDFKQPKKVYIDVLMLETLGRMDVRNGLAETIKHGIIQDAEFFEYLEKNIDLLLEKDKKSLLYIAMQNCRIKGNVVEQDPNEKGLRRILNYGHTAGHAIEKLSCFKLAHGESVSIGMMVAGRIANLLGYFSEPELAQQEKLLQRVGLPTEIPKEISNEEIIEATAIDKKAQGSRARYVLPLAIGKMHEFDGAYATYVDNCVVLKALQKTR
ncbi:3-dehydroquinate synthase [Candidatus Woesearchaeota archaeon]|nr:3-dehydroquinate synthase [Candidatus Woesearchaeota archaeon]